MRTRDGYLVSKPRSFLIPTQTLNIIRSSVAYYTCSIIVNLHVRLLVMNECSGIVPTPLASTGVMQSPISRIVELYKIRSEE